MANKKKFTFITSMIAAGMLLSACGFNPISSDPSSSQPSEPSSSINDDSSSAESSSSAVVNKFVVKFVVEGRTVQTSEVEEGELAVYEGEVPSKQHTNPNRAYRFKGWDKDLSQPITANTTFTAVFEEVEYASEIMVDDFESYRSKGAMKEAGWTALGFDTSTNKWTDATKAAVSLGTNSVEGEKALRFDAWENGVGYKFVKYIQEGTFTKSANALRFRLMVPAINMVKVLLKGKVTIAGQEQAPSFSYQFQPKSGEYVEYTLPLSSDNWILWDDTTKTLKSTASWMGVHEDDYLRYLTSIDFFIQGSDASIGGNGWPYMAFLDSVKFVTVDSQEATQVETYKRYDRYTGALASGKTVTIDVGANNDAIVKIYNSATPLTINGSIAIANGQMTFTSSDNGATLKYVGNITNGGQQIKFISSEGPYSMATTDLNFNAVQVVDNYEQYTTDGVSYYTGATQEQRSGCRGAYYSEYYAGSGSSDWGGNGWSLMGGDGSQLKLKQDSAGAHSGNNYLCLKHSKDKAMRYMQWGLFDGSSEKNSFRGSKFSFWAKSNGWVKNFKFYMYSQSAPTNATRDNYVKSNQFTENAAIGEWTHYDIDLNPNVIYYGFMVLLEKNYDLSDSQAYLYIDDVEVYTVSPYVQA